MITNILDNTQSLPQRQDSVADQLADLRLVANKLGMYDAADAIKQWCKELPDLKYGCFIDGDIDVYHDCVIDNGSDDSCIYAKEGVRKEQCEYWRMLSS